MSEMIERVARAMWHDFVMLHGFPSPYPTWEEMADSDNNKRDVRSNARAAIEAMREPTEAMTLALIGAAPAQTIHSAAFDGQAVWRAGIDAALSTPAHSGDEG